MTPRRLPSRLGLGLLVIALFVSPVAAMRAQAQTLAINQSRIEIKELIQQVGEATERTILFDESVRGVVSIVAKRPVTLDEAWAMLDSSLAMLGYSLLPSTADMWKIAKVAEAVGESPFVRKADFVGESVVTTLIPLRVADPEALMAILMPLAGASVTLVPFAPSQSLIASGPERRIARLTTIADALDRVDELPIRFRVLRHRDAEEVAEWLESFFESGALSERDLEVWTDERSNSLIYRGTDLEVARLLRFVDRFDRAIEGRGEIQVWKVLNRDAQEIADLIQALGGDQESTRSVQLLDGFGAESLDALAGSDYSIVVDAPTRSLVVRGDAQSQATIRGILEMLDQPPQLIAVDVKVVEVRTPRSFRLGFAFSIPLSAGDDEGEVIARLVSTPGGAGLAATPGAETTIFGRVDQQLGLPFALDDGTGLVIPLSNTGVIEAGDLSAHTEILTEPSLILTAGDRHELFVGNNVPVPVAAASPFAADGTTAAADPLSRSTTFERKDVGITIVIEAAAARDGPILIDLDVGISQLAPSLAGNIEQVGPTFVEQRFIANARLKDRQAAVIAVNRDLRTTKIRQGTPFLSSIPLLGTFFSRSVDRQEDVHLVLAVQARRVNGPAALAVDTIRRRLAFQRRNADDDALPTVLSGMPAYAVLVTTQSRRDDAEAIAASLDLRRYATTVHAWTLGERELFDVYVMSLESMADAAEVASRLAEDGWPANLMLLPSRS